MSICAILFVNKSYSQDFHLSQFDAFAQYLNPAMTGSFNGDFRVNVHTRSQWAKVIQNPYFTTGVGFDVPQLLALQRSPSLRSLKLGAYILNERAGTGKFNVFNFAISAAKDFSLNDNNRITAGLQLGFINKSVDFNALNFGSQYTTKDKGGFDMNTSSGEVFSNASTAMPDINLGVLYYFTKEQSLFIPFFGIAAFHLTQPKEDFLNSTNKLPRRFNAHGGTKINYSKYHQVNIHFLVMQQTSNVRELQGNVMGMSFLKGRDDFCLLYGFGYRNANNQDAGIIHMGLKYGDITGRVSYDINISDLKTFSNGQGGFEFSLIYVRSKPIIIPPTTCPRI